MFHISVAAQFQSQLEPLPPCGIGCYSSMEYQRGFSIRVIRGLILKLGCVLGGAWLGHVQAAQFTVQMTPSWTFNPSYLEIQASDTVTWINLDDSDSHDSVSTQGYWDSGLLDYMGTYSFQFPVTGTFPYVDSFYDQAGMTGTIVVKPVTVVPQPLLINPLGLTNGFQFGVTNLIVGKTNILQSSTNLAGWTGFYTNVASRTGYTYVDMRPAVQRRYYRAMALP